MEDDYLPEIQHYCNFMYETLLTVTAGAYDLHTNKEARKLAGITMVAAGYAGDMPEGLCYDLLDDIDFHYNEVKCKQSFRAVLCTLIYISTFVPNLNFGQDEHKRRRQVLCLNGSQIPNRVQEQEPSGVL